MALSDVVWFPKESAVADEAQSSHNEVTGSSDEARLSHTQRIPRPMSLRKCRSQRTGICMRKSSEALDDAGTLDDFIRKRFRTEAAVTQRKFFKKTVWGSDFDHRGVLGKFRSSSSIGNL